MFANEKDTTQIRDRIFRGSRTSQKIRRCSDDAALLEPLFLCPQGLHVP